MSVSKSVGLRSLEQAGPRAEIAVSRSKPRRVLAKLRAAPAGFDPNHLHGAVAEKFVEQPDRVRAAAHAGVEMRRQTLLRGENLLARLAPNHALKIAHHRRIGMRAEHRAEQVVGRAH